MKILLLEDDEILNEIIEGFLQSKGYEVFTSYDGEEAQDLIAQHSFDVLLLDVNVPLINGFELLKNTRAQNINTPAIFLTSLDDTKSMKDGFLSGCDDYIKKPFEFDELDLRIENIKRLYKLDTKSITNISLHVKYDFSKSAIIKDDGEHILSKKESKVFEYFLKNRNRTISSYELSINVWAYDESPSDSTIRTYIKNFRKILGDACITTVKGVGYRFN